MVFIPVIAIALAVLGAQSLTGAEVPQLKVGYIFTTNHTPLMVAMKLGDKFNAGGYTLSEVMAKEKYMLRKNGNDIAMLDILVTKSGSETATLFAQGNLDIGLASITAIMDGVDSKSPIKIVAPLILASGGLVVGKNSPVNDWAGFIAAIKSSKTPLNVGYHSPSSSPIIILEEALRSEGIRISYNPMDSKAQVILVDLKGTQNLLPALSSGQVFAAVGPDPFPPNAEVRGAGKGIIQLRDMPPAGKWTHYPCCVVSASDKLIASNPALVQEFVNFIISASRWCNDNQEQASILAAQWIGLSEDVGKLLRSTFLESFTDGWKDGADGFMEVLDQSGHFNGVLKGKSFRQSEDLLLDPRFLK